MCAGKRECMAWKNPIRCQLTKPLLQADSNKGMWVAIMVERYIALPSAHAAAVLCCCRLTTVLRSSVSSPTWTPLPC